MRIDPEMIIYIVSGIILLIMGTGGGIGVRQYFILRQNGDSTVNILKHIDNNQKKSTKLLYKLDNKIDADKELMKKDQEMQRERQKILRVLEQKEHEQIIRCLKRIEDR